MAKRSEEPTPAGFYLQVQTYRSNYACERIPVGMYLQADKPLFPLPLVHIIPPEKPFAPAAEHEAPLGDQQSEGNKEVIIDRLAERPEELFER